MVSARHEVLLVIFSIHKVQCFVSQNGPSILSHERRYSRLFFASPDDSKDNEEDNMLQSTLDEQMDRRKVFSQALLSLSALTATAVVSPSPSSAFTKTFPGELQAADGIMDDRQIKKQYIAQKQQRSRSSLIPNSVSQPLGALLWGSALWFLSGSRSNPLATPLANILYDDSKESWLKDRNDGLFADLPLPLLGMLVVVFFAVGVGTDNLLTLLAQGNHNASLQLAGVTLIGAGTLELGRIASGEKKQTRQESDRDVLLEREFAEFADKRLLRSGGSCHRNEVVAAFRRYYSKYRQAEDPTFPLADLEIEQLLRAWSRVHGVEMTNAGFYYGIKINKDADAFA